MIDKRKIRFGWLAFAFLVIHFSLIFIFALPDHWKNKQVDAVASSYVNPIFYQKWNMFAPCPFIDGSIKVQYHFSNEKTNWFRPVKQALEKHNFLRATHHGELVLAEANTIYFLYHDLLASKLLPINGDTASFPTIPKNTNGFKKLKTFVLGYGDYLFEEPVEYCSVICDFRDVRDNSSKQVKIEKIDQWKN